MNLFDFGQGITLKELLENPDLKNPPNLNNGSTGTKGKMGGGKIDSSSAFLGPNLWNNPDNNDFNLEFMDLDEFLSETGIGVGENSNSNSNETKLTQSQSSPSEVEDIVDVLLPMDPSEDEISKSPPASPKASASLSPVPSPEIQYDIDPSDLALASIPGQNFDPKRRRFTEDELKPQPIIKKSRKVYVPDECKDQKYWSRRKKNNIAAKRSREARRIKENQIALRAAYLEKENNSLKDELKKMQLENTQLTQRLKKYEG
uniref:Hepatic leukemia factor-like n=1 Tax=Crassostrea virginica TaxID=6565 RepID=A0A8B8F1N2_CRAVI|nr:hepatic leukemia factor-like [Crassostrea virginica]